LNIRSFGLSWYVVMWSRSLVVRFSLSGMVLALPFLAVVGFTVLWSRSKSLALSLVSSTGLSPVSMLSCSFMDRSFPALAMSICSFSLVGSAMFRASGVYFGISHLMFLCLQYLL